MNTLDLNGCCAAKWWYNMGGAHGFPTASSQSEFDKWVASKHKAGVNICVLNGFQNQTKGYMLTQGWTEHKVNGLSVMLISRDDLNKYYVKIGESAAKKKLMEKGFIGKVTLSDVRTLMVDPVLRSNKNKNDLEKFYGVKIPLKYLGRLPYTVFNSIKSSITAKKKTNGSKKSSVLSAG